MNAAFVIAFFISSTVAVASSASEVSCSYMEHRRQVYEEVYNQIFGKIFELRKTGLSINKDTIKLEIPAASSATYGGGVKDPHWNVRATFETESGTKLRVWGIIPSRTVVIADGYSSEGNPVNGRCDLLFYPSAPKLDVTNIVTGIVVGELPGSLNDFTIYKFQ